jgi:hypothetical protein
LETIPVYDCFAYSITYNNNEEIESFEKHIYFLGNRFSQTRPYAILPETRHSGIPEEIRNILRFAPEDVLLGLGVEKNSSRELKNKRAAVRAVAELARQTSAMVQNILRDYTEGEEGLEINLEENISSATSSFTFSGLLKVLDIVSEDNNHWHAWQLPKSSY